MSSPDGFTRRICAVMLADVSGYSAMVGRDDERTAQAVRQLQEMACAIVAEARGSAEVRGGDALVAIFDSVVAAVDAALAILRRLNAEAVGGTRLQIRIGINFGDVLLRESGSLSEAVGDAINIAARLEALAKPGTICVSEGVFRHVRHKLDETFVDLGRQQLKNISDPIHAYLIVPRELGPLRRSSAGARWLWAAGAALAVALAAAGFFYRRSVSTSRPVASGSITLGSPQPLPVDASAEQPAEQVALGVMGFKIPGDASGSDWRRDALRDGLNTQLSRLSHVKVYSKEFIDFLISRKGLTEIEAASQLGIRKMLSGSVVENNGVLQIEIHVVDVGSGVLESSSTTAGPEDRFLELQNKLALDVISRLNLPATDAEKQVLLAQQSTDVEALRLLLDAERGAAGPAPTAAPVGPRSELWPASQWLGDAPAFADGNADAAIRDVVDRYRKAMEGRNAAALAALYSEFPPDLQAAQQRYFDNVRDLKVSIDNLDIAVVGNEAVVSYTRTDDFTDARTGQPMHVAVRVTKMLRESDGTWKLTAQ
jgi:adenylate cyclase